MKKLSIDVNPIMEKDLKRLTELTGKDEAALINSSLTLMEWAIDTIAAGREVALLEKHRDYYEILDLPIFEVVRQRSIKTTPRLELVKK